MPAKLLFVVFLICCEAGFSESYSATLDGVFRQALKKHHTEPAPRCTDETFVRRVFLDLTGTLPTAQEVRDFLNETRSDKRRILVGKLLERPEFTDFQALRWSDLLRVKAEFPINLWPAGAAAYHRWIRESVRTNKPYDVFVRELLLSDGSNFRNGAVNFYRAVQAKDAETLAETVMLTFLGVRTQPWSEEKQKQSAAFFSRVGYKETAEWKEEIVFWTHQPLDNPNVVFPDGTKGTVAAEQDPRQVFTDWLVSSENKGFQQYIANRVWFWLFGQGLVNESDDFRNDNPPVYPEVLEFLCQELVRSKYDLKHLYRVIANSEAYQQRSGELKVNREERKRKLSVPFTSYPVRRVEAEVLQDALAKIFKLPVSYNSEVPEPYTFISSRYRTITLADASVTSSFLEMFGRPSRDTGLESDRNNGVTESQQLFMLNSTEVNNWVSNYVQKYRKFERKPGEFRKMLDEIYLTFLSRYPTDKERLIIAESFSEPAQSSKRPVSHSQNLQDVLWALLNTKEFLCKH